MGEKELENRIAETINNCYEAVKNYEGGRYFFARRGDLLIFIHLKIKECVQEIVFYKNELVLRADKNERDNLNYLDKKIINDFCIIKYRPGEWEELIKKPNKE